MPITAGVIVLVTPRLSLRAHVSAHRGEDLKSQAAWPEDWSQGTSPGPVPTLSRLDLGMFTLGQGPGIPIRAELLDPGSQSPQCLGHGPDLQSLWQAASGRPGQRPDSRRSREGSCRADRSPSQLE